MIDKNAFRAVFSDFDAEIIHEIIDIYVREHPLKFDQMLTSLEESDLRTLRNVAHGLKGVLSQFFAPEAQQQAKELEYFVRDLLSHVESGSGNQIEDAKKAQIMEMIHALKGASLHVIDDLLEIKAEFK